MSAAHHVAPLHICACISAALDSLILAPKSLMLVVSSQARDRCAMQVGLISDTHGLVRASALEALRGCQLIIHAGDVGTAEVLDALGAIAPVFAVRGNNDTGPWARYLPETDAVTIENRVLYVLHDLSQLDLDPAAAAFAAVISGHSHKPQAKTRDGVLYINPGSAGPRRFKLPIAVARLHVDDHALTYEHVELEG